MKTFDVSDVLPSRQSRAAVTLRDSLQTRTQGPIEACGSNLPNLIAGVAPKPSMFGTRGTLTGKLNAFVEAASVSFTEHHPFVLSPDDIWLCVAQGFGLHINLHAEELRGRFVRHHGKDRIEIRRDEFVKGSSANDWPNCFGEISDEIAERIGKKRDLVVASFSTTGAIEKTAFEVVLMDAMQSYCDYSVMTLCGIPTITLLGTVDDWRSIRLRAEMLAEFDLGWWVTALLPILDQFVAASRGQVDRAFWQSFYKLKDESGGPCVTGWLNVLFPYLDNETDELDETDELNSEEADERPTRLIQPVRNRFVEAWERVERTGPAPGQFPLGLSKAPFLWTILDTPFRMEVLGGFVGVSQDSDTYAIRPAIGWAVRDDEGTDE